MKPIHITDHAVVRYIERVVGFDLEVVRRNIAKAVKDAATIGTARVTVDGFTYAMRHDDVGSWVVTVHPADDASRPIKPPKAKDRPHEMPNAPKRGEINRMKARRGR